MGAGAWRGSDQGGDHGNRDRDRFERRRRSFNNWYNDYYPYWLANGYPYGLGYPYVIDPGFYDWSEPDDSADDQAGAAPDYEAPSPDYGYGPPGEPPDQGYDGELPPWNPANVQPAAATSVASAPLSDEPLTVIFKSGRAPVKMQNYMMTAKVLTDLDSRHYLQIPLDEIDVAATQRANASAGIDFQIPNATRD
jgi:hypothetical protein